MLEIKRFVFGPFETNCYVVSDEATQQCAIVDPACEASFEDSQLLQYLEEHHDDPRPLRLIRQQTVTPSLPLYIIYYTAYPNPESGAVEYWSDPYGYDAVIAATHPCMLR